MENTFKIFTEKNATWHQPAVISWSLETFLKSSTLGEACLTVLLSPRLLLCVLINHSSSCLFQVTILVFFASNKSHQRSICITMHFDVTKLSILVETITLLWSMNRKDTGTKNEKVDLLSFNCVYGSFSSWLDLKHNSMFILIYLFTFFIIFSGLMWQIQELQDKQQVDEYEAHVITDWKTVAGVLISSRGTGGNQATDQGFPVVKPGDCSFCFSGSSVNKQDGKEWDPQK